MDKSTAVALACLTVLAIVLAIACRRRRAPRDGFFTEHGQEEPTRSYVPYTGTVPVGHWGAQPWAEEFPPSRGGEFRCGMSGRGWQFLTDAENLGRRGYPPGAEGAYWDTEVPAIE